MDATLGRKQGWGRNVTLSLTQNTVYSGADRGPSNLPILLAKMMVMRNDVLRPHGGVGSWTKGWTKD